MVNLELLEFPSATGKGTVKARLYWPEISALRPENILLQIGHGMAEHMQRYDSFCRHMAGLGYAVCIHDQAGHGQTVPSDDYLGYFGESDGLSNLCQDIDTLAEQAVRRLEQESGDGRSWRRVFLGHSMGAFIGQFYCTKPGQPLAGAIFSGTAGSNPAVHLGLFLAERSVRKYGSVYKDEFLAALTWNGFLKKIPGARTKLDWLSRDTAVVDAYIADPKCGFTFTAAGYRDLYTCLIAISQKDWAAKVPAGLPIFLLSGAEDPVGNYSKGPRQVQSRLVATGHQADLKIFPDGRHEMLNEINYTEAWQAIADWLNLVYNSQ